MKLSNVRHTSEPTAADAVVKGNNEFALDLYSRLVRAGASNLFFSPYSICNALAMTFAGARGRTAKEMADVLCLPESADLQSAFAGLNESIFAAQKHGCTLNVANRLWVQQGYRLITEFLELLRTNYGAELDQLDFAGQPDAASRTINRWVEEQTAGRITDLISPQVFNALTRLLLVNAVYFKGEWTRRFEEVRTHEAAFHAGLFNRVHVQMMHQAADFSYAKADGVQVLELPYGDRALSMVVLLPGRMGGLARLEAALSADRVNAWLGVLWPQKVKVYLPKFRLTEMFTASGVLKSMGMAAAFSATDADFSGISDESPGLYISDVIHKAFIEVNEEGTEAAAATAVPMIMTGLRSVAPSVPVFRADHPFLFFIRHRPSGSLLFVGRVMAPSA